MADEIEKKETKVNNLEEFKNWLIQRDKKVGEGKLAHRTRGGYVSALKRSFRDFRREYGSYEDVFAINNPHEFAGIVHKIEANTEVYVNYNSHRNFSSGAEVYHAFLDGEGPGVGSYEGGRYGGLTYDQWIVGTPPPPPPPTQTQTKEPRNLIFFGAPGTGKSFLLNDRSNELLKPDGESIRVTFHPEYSYAHFVGTYKPVPEGSEITYKYVPGPFMETYVKAVENPNNRYMLIIEEINRANVAAVFGDVFQLLDRKNGVSEYPVKASKDMRDYLEKDVDDNKKRKWNPADCKEIRIPENMYIWATMNSADQGVFPMDTAFKRRWEFEYLPITAGENAEKIRDAMVPMGNENEMMKWNDVRKYINDLLARLGINEDKQLGAFFINAEIVANAASGKEGGDRFKNTFKDKVLMYLFEDAAKHKRKEMFGTNKDNGNKRYSEIRKAFDDTGMGVFEGWQEKTGDGNSKTGGTGSTDGTPTPEGNAGEREP